VDEKNLRFVAIKAKLRERIPRENEDREIFRQKDGWLNGNTNTAKEKEKLEIKDKWIKKTMKRIKKYMKSRRETEKGAADRQSALGRKNCFKFFLPFLFFRFSFPCFYLPFMLIMFRFQDSTAKKQILPCNC
jgi:hypothetical protein